MSRTRSDMITQEAASQTMNMFSLPNQREKDNIANSVNCKINCGIIPCKKIELKLNLSE